MYTNYNYLAYFHSAPKLAEMRFSLCASTSILGMWLANIPKYYLRLKCYPKNNFNLIFNRFTLYRKNIGLTSNFALSRYL